MVAKKQEHHLFENIGYDYLCHRDQHLHSRILLILNDWVKRDKWGVNHSQSELIQGQDQENPMKSGIYPTQQKMAFEL